METEKKRLSINIVAQAITFIVQFIISFFLTPFIVHRLGTEAYGYIGLADSFVLYAQVLTIALQSMAGRYISIAYHRNNLKEANVLFSSVLFANILFATIIFTTFTLCTIHIEYIIKTPPHLLADIKLLFTLTFFSFSISIIFSTYHIATFIKNRLELDAIRNIISNIIKVILLLTSFTLFSPHLWYIGFTSILCSIYIALRNIKYTKALTPELTLNLFVFNLKKIKEILSSGIWNSFTKLGNLLGQGLDLLFANLFIDAFAMGSLSITKQVPLVIVGFVSSICAAFAPSLTKKYALKQQDSLKKELLFSTKVASSISLVPCSFIIVFGDLFYSLWLPNTDANLLHKLTVLGIIAIPIGMSLEGIQNIFTIANKVKIYSIATFSINLLCFFTIISTISFIEEKNRIYFLVATSSFWSLIRVLFFLPIYGAYCINEKKSFFFSSIIRTVFSFSVSLFLLIISKKCIHLSSWYDLFIAILLTCFICTCSTFLFIFEKKDRRQLLLVFNKIRGCFL